MEAYTSGEKGPRSGIVVVGLGSSSWEHRRSADPSDLDLLMPGVLRGPSASEGGRDTGMLGCMEERDTSCEVMTDVATQYSTLRLCV